MIHGMARRLSLLGAFLVLSGCTDWYENQIATGHVEIYDELNAGNAPDYIIKGSRCRISEDMYMEKVGDTYYKVKCEGGMSGYVAIADVSGSRRLFDPGIPLGYDPL